MKKHVSIGFVLLLCTALFFGCSASDNLPDGMEADRLESLAKDTLDLMNARDYEALSQNVSSGVADASQWQNSLEPMLEQLGDFLSYKETTFATVQDNGQDIVNVLVECEYENGRVILRVPIDTNYQVLGIWAAG